MSTAEQELPQTQPFEAHQAATYPPRQAAWDSVLAPNVTAGTAEIESTSGHVKNARAIRLEEFLGTPHPARTTELPGGNGNQLRHLPCPHHHYRHVSS